ncbi:MAG: ferrous iron transport protein B [Terriglobia bacterium]
MALVGQPNSGKSTLFNSVAGYRSVTANFPGATVHYTSSQIRFQGLISQLIDLPGIYSLTVSNPAERASRNFLLGVTASAIIHVIDSSVLSRSLELTLQLLELGVPMVVCLNMMDEAHRKGIRIDSQELSDKLGVPVVETVAAEGIGIHRLFQETFRLIDHLSDFQSRLAYDRDTEETIDHLRSQIERLPNLPSRLPPRMFALRLLEGDDQLAEHLHSLPAEAIDSARRQLEVNRGKSAEEVIESERHALSMKLFETVAAVSTPPHDLREKLDGLLTHRVWGYVILAGMLVAFFGIVYGIGNLLESRVLSIFEEFLAITGQWLSHSPLSLTFVRGLTQGIAGGTAIVLPYLLPFLMGMAILEDVGYLPRVAFLMDSFMHRIGLHGIAVIPAVLGYGCNVPAVMATRILSSPRDRFIAAFLSTLTPCSARMTVIFGLVAFYLGPWWALLIYVLNLVVIALSGKILTALLPECSPGLILEVPPYRKPRLSILLRKTWLRMKEFVVIAWPLLIAGSLLLSLGEYYHWDRVLNKGLSPLTALLGLPASVGTTLLFGVLRKELSMIMLMQALGTTQVQSVMTVGQIFVFTLFITFYIPCVATLAALIKEIGWREAIAVAAYSLFSAVLIGLGGRLLFAMV